MQINRSEETWLPNAYTYICLLHLKDEDKYYTKIGRVYLKKTVIPYDENTTQISVNMVSILIQHVIAQTQTLTVVVQNRLLNWFKKLAYIHGFLYLANKISKIWGCIAANSYFVFFFKCIYMLSTHKHYFNEPCTLNIITEYVWYRHYKKTSYKYK